MLTVAVAVGIGGLTLAAALAMVRVLFGPTLSDRLIALDAITVIAIGLIVLFGLQQRSPHYLDAAILLAILGFVSTVAAAKYILRGRIVERDRG